MVRTLKTAGISLRGGISAFLVLFVFTGISSALEKEYDIAVTKGAYKIDTGDYKEAITHFKTALKLKPSDKHATLLLGISQSRAGQYRQAKVAILKALRLDPSDWRTRYELGVASFHLGEIKEARYHLEKVKASDADDSIKTAADEYLYVISSGQVSKKKPVSLAFLAALQYDSNVILEPTDPIVKGKKKDWRTLFVFDGRWAFLNTGKMIGEAGYMFYQSAHDVLDEFNLQQHNLMFSGKYSPKKTLHMELDYKISYSTIGGNLYSSINSVAPAVTIIHSPRIASNLYYIHEFKKYFNSDTFSFNSQKTGNACQTGITERIRLGDSSSVSIGYVYDWDTADAKFWKYNGHKGTAEFSSFLGKWKVFLGASYHDRKYEAEFPGFSKKRHDGMQEYSTILTWNPSGRISCSISELYVINSSNLGVFNYNRSIAGLFLEVRL